MRPSARPVLTYKKVYAELRDRGYPDAHANPVARVAALAGIEKNRKAAIDYARRLPRTPHRSLIDGFYAARRLRIVPVRADPASLNVVARILTFHDPYTVSKVLGVPNDEVRGAMLTHLLELGPAAAKGFGHFMYSAPLPFALKL